MNLYETYKKLNESSRSARKLLAMEIQNHREILKKYQLLSKQLDKIEKYFSSEGKEIDLGISQDEDYLKLTIYVLNAKSIEEMKEFKKITDRTFTKMGDVTGKDIEHGMLKYRMILS